MLSPLRSLLDVAELASQSHSLLVLLVFCFGGLFVFVCLLFVCGCFACVGCWDLYRSMTVQLLRLFSIAYVNALTIHSSCNMQLNVLNDLAKAKRRWTEKNLHQFQSSAQINH